MTIHTFPRFSARKKNLDLMKLFLSDPRFQSDIEALKNMPNPNTKESKSVDVALFMEAIARLYKLSGLPENFYWYIKDYIICGRVGAPLNNFNVTPHFIDDECQEISHLSPNIYTNLTADEFSDLKEEVQRMNRNLLKVRPVKDIDKKLRSEKVYKERDIVNENPDKEYVLTVAEVVGRHQAKKTYEHSRELRELRKKRLGK